MPHPEAGRIGPNAIIRIAEALETVGGRDLAARVLTAAGLRKYVGALPESMVDEAEVSRLHAALRGGLDGDTAEAVCRMAGQATADYLLAVRIPRPAQAVLKRLWPSAASGLLLKAIGNHAWTFAGNGTFTVRPGRPVRLSIAGCPVCRDLRGPDPLCAYYTATFEGLYRALVSRRATVRETACQAAGAPACVFEIVW